MREIHHTVIIHRPRLVLTDRARPPVQQAVDDLMHGLMTAQALFSVEERRKLGAAVQTLRRAAERGG